MGARVPRLRRGRARSDARRTSAHRARRDLRPSSAAGSAGRSRSASWRTSTRAPTLGARRPRRAGDSRLAAHAARRRRRRVPPLLARRCRLPAVTMLEQPTSAPPDEPPRQGRARDPGRRRPRARVPSRDRVRADARRAAEVERSGDDRPHAHAALPQEAPVRTVTVTVTGRRSGVTALRRPRAARRG